MQPKCFIVNIFTTASLSTFFHFSSLKNVYFLTFVPIFKTVYDFFFEFTSMYSRRYLPRRSQSGYRLEAPPRCCRRCHRCIWKWMIIYIIHRTLYQYFFGRIKRKFNISSTMKFCKKKFETILVFFQIRCSKEILDVMVIIA